MESTQRTRFSDLCRIQQLEHIEAEEGRYLQLCLANPPVSAEGPLHGANYQFRHQCGTVPSYVPLDSQNAQPAYDGTMMMVSGYTTAGSADSAAYLRGATQSECQVPQVSYNAYAQQPKFALPKTSATPAMSLSSCHEAFIIDPQPPVGHSDITNSPLANSGQLIHTVSLKVRAGELREIVGHLMDNLQYLKTHIKGWGEPTVMIHFRFVSVLALRFLLGFTVDHDDRKELKTGFWDNVNNAWLATLQHQRDLTREMMLTNQPLRNSDAIISAGALERLGDEVVKFCDDIEKYGLVDYQMGFREEDIINREWSWTL